MKRAILALAAASTVAAFPVQAALECSAYDDLVAQAVMIMQIAPSNIVPPEGGGEGNCTVTGAIVRSFLGPHPVGTVVQTAIPCKAPITNPDLANPVTVGPTRWWDYAELQAAAVIELHIAPTGGPAGHGAGVVLLEEPSEAPMWQSLCQRS